MTGKGAGSRCHDSVVTISDVSFSYEGRPVITHLNYAVLERDFVGLIGSNGAGKTTLLRMIVGLLRPDEGEIRLFGEPVRKFKDWQRIGYVPQRKSFNPHFPATVREVVMSGLYVRNKIGKRITHQDAEKCSEALQALGIADLAERKIGHLSGGQQQRVFLARALVNSPDLLILDEPTVGVDRETQASFFRLIRHMHERHRITFLMVSHDIEMMQAYLGSEPAHVSGGLHFYVKHSHELENCAETDLLHSLQDFGKQLQPAEVLR